MQLRFIASRGMLANLEAVPWPPRVLALSELLQGWLHYTLGLAEAILPIGAGERAENIS